MQNNNDRLLKLTDVIDMIKISKSKIYEIIKEGRFPNAVRITPRCVRWKESAILAWIEHGGDIAPVDHHM